MKTVNGTWLHKIIHAQTVIKDGVCGQTVIMQKQKIFKKYVMDFDSEVFQDLPIMVSLIFFSVICSYFIRLLAKNMMAFWSLGINL